MNNQPYDNAVRVPAKAPNETWLENISRFISGLPVEIGFMGEPVRKPLLLTHQQFSELVQEVKPYWSYSEPLEHTRNLIYGHPVIIEPRP